MTHAHKVVVHHFLLEGHKHTDIIKIQEDSEEEMVPMLSTLLLTQVKDKDIITLLNNVLSTLDLYQQQLINWDIVSM